MGAINSAGVGSGLDVSSIVTQLMKIERQQMTVLQQQQSDTNSQISAFGQLQSSLSSLQTATNNLKSVDKFSVYKATVPTDAGFTATAGAKAVGGQYAISVEKLAQSQKVLSTVHSTDMNGAFAGTGGSLSFTVGSGSPVNVTVAAGASLKDIRDAVNSANFGVTASIVQNGSKYDLQFSSSTTGAANAFKVSSTGDASLNNLTFDPASGTNPMLATVSAQDAEVKIDGQTYTSTTNTLTGAIQDVTLNLSTAKPGTAVNVTLAKDNDAITNNVKTLVDAYNKVNTELRSLTSYDTTTKTGGALNGDFTARSLQFGMRNVFQNALGGSGSLQRLSDIGITFQKDGSMSLDSSKLGKVLNDPSKDISQLFITTNGTQGLADKMSTYLDGMIGTSGAVTTRVEGLNNKIKLQNKDMDALSTRLSDVEARYRKQFNDLDTMMVKLNQTNSALTAALSKL